MKNFKGPRIVSSIVAMFVMESNCCLHPLHMIKNMFKSMSRPSQLIMIIYFFLVLNEFAETGFFIQLNSRLFCGKLGKFELHYCSSFNYSISDPQIQVVLQ